MNAHTTSLKYAAPRGALVMRVSRLGIVGIGIGAANASFAPVCTGF